MMTTLDSLMVLAISVALSTTTTNGVRSTDIVNPTPRQILKAGVDSYSFHGDATEPDHFKLLESDGDFLLVGARNHVYNLSADSLQLQQTLEWRPTEEETSMCRRKGKSQEDCHNYIRVLVKQPGPTGWTLVCGTNAYKPTCRQYEHDQETGYRTVREFDGYAISPYDPRDNATAVYLPATDEIYSATVSDFSGEDALIYKKRLSLLAPAPDGGAPASGHELRTKRNDATFLDHPNFVGSFESGDYVYFWFRETAVEYVTTGGDDSAPSGGSAGATTTKPTYGRVARVCKGDMGGAGVYDGGWTTFVKARLDCALNQSNHFLHFNELQAISDPMRSSEGDEMVYAVFGTPTGMVQMSAVCAFRMRDVRRVFDQGAFKHQRQPDTIWAALPEQLVPKKGPRPGTCTSDSRKLSKEVISFIRRNPLMDPSVQNAFDRPLLIDSTFKAQFTQIAVHQQVRAVNGRHYDVIFVGTNKGLVLKLLNTAAAQRHTAPVLIEEVVATTSQRSAETASIRNLLVYGGGEGAARLIVVSSDAVRSLPVAHCRRQTSCAGCVRLQDPYCAWNRDAARCETGGRDGKWTGATFVQNLLTGVSSLCPEGEGEYTIEEYSDVDNRAYYDGAAPSPVGASDKGKSASSGLAIAIFGTLAIGSTIGFIVGFVLARQHHRRCREKAAASHPSTPTTGSAASSEYDTNSMGRSRLTRHDGVARALAAHHLNNNIQAPPEYGATAVPASKLLHPHASQQHLRHHLHHHQSTSPLETTNGGGVPVSVMLNLTGPNDGLPQPTTLPYHSGTLKFERNVMTASVGGGVLSPPPHTGTLPKNYKVKMVYL